MHSDQEPVQALVDKLGECKTHSPLPFGRFVPDDKMLTMHISQEMLEDSSSSPRLYAFEEAGPREQVYFDPSKTKCAIVTCGGLCPGINDVIRALVMEAHHQYGITTTLGIRFGLQGFMPEYGHPVSELTPDTVTRIHEFGGTILGSSRGHQPTEAIVDALERMNVNILFLIGGDGTMKATAAIHKEVMRRNIKLSLIGIPKTIDNDIYFVSKSFGFDTAVSKATEAIRCAHTEAQGAPNGIGLVKLMGRESGFIAAEAALAQRDVNFVFIPEEQFALDAPNGFLPHLEERIHNRGHAVVVVAEGAGQNLCRIEVDHNGEMLTDASGNPVLADICGTLQEQIKSYFKAKGLPITLKYIDPSYIIRSVPANSSDNVYCGFLGQHAVHAAMAGKTNMVVTRLQDRYVYLPLELVTQKRRKLNVHSNYWRAVLESTGQPIHMRNT